MNTRILILLGIMGMTLVSHGQAARGYLGKMRMISYQADFWPAGLTAARSMNHSAESGVTPLHLRHSLSYQHVVSRKYALIGKFTYAPSYLKPVSWVNGYETEGIGPLDYAYRDSYFTNIRDPEYDNTPFAAYELSFGFRKYTRVLAPAGHFFGFSLGYAFLQTDYDFSEYYNYSGNSGRQLAPESEKVNAGVIRLNWEMGATRVISDRFVIEYGGGLGFSLLGIGASTNYFSGLVENEASYDEPQYTDLDDPADYTGGVKAAMITGYSSNTYFMLKLSVGMIM